MLCNALERQDLLDDARFTVNVARLANLPALVAELEQAFTRRTTAEWVELLLAAGIPAGPILDYREALESEHARTRDMVMEMQHPVEGPVRALGFPVKLSATQQ